MYILQANILRSDVIILIKKSNFFCFIQTPYKVFNVFFIVFIILAQSN